MLTEEDLHQISELLKKQTQAFDKKLDDKFAAQKVGILTEVSKQLAKQQEEIVREVGEFIHDQLLPLFDAHDQRITRLEKHTNPPPLPAV